MTDQSAPQTESTRVPLVVLGLVVGIVAFLVYLVVMVLVSYAAAVEDTTPMNALLTALLALPILPGAVLLRGRRSRRAAAGFVMGLALGLIASAATCATYLLVAVASD